MKNLFKMATLIVAASLALSSCNCFKKMGKETSAVKVTTNPEVLTLNNGKIPVDVKAEIPANYFDKKASLCVTPALVYEGGVVLGESVLLQGEKVISNGILVKSNEKMTINRHVEFDYVPAMDICELKLIVEVKCKKCKVRDYDKSSWIGEIMYTNGYVPGEGKGCSYVLVDTANGKLIEGGSAMSAADRAAYGLTIAKGLNTLQKEFNYADALSVAGNNYKNVTTVVTKADIAYKINSATVTKKATKTEQIDALQKKVAENAENDRISQSVYVNGYASPDGPEKFNDCLSKKRSNAALKAVSKLLKESNVPIDAAAYGEDWDGFRKAVVESDIADKDLILQILSMYNSAAEREKEIKNLSSIFKALKTEVLPQLRRAEIVNSADVTGKTDAEMVALIESGKVAALDLEEALHIAAVEPSVAKKALEYAAKRYNDARAYNNLAVVYAQNGNNDAALEALNKAAKADGKLAELQNNYTLVYLAKGDIAKAEQYAKGASAEVKGLVAAAKGEYTAANNLTGYNAAVAYVQSGNLAAAKKALSNDASAKADYLRAVIAAKEGNITSGKASLQSAISKDASLAAKAKKDINLAALL